MTLTAQSTITTDKAKSGDGIRLFTISFTALFLELMIIRWVPAVVPLVAYYSNLMLISSFLGLGLGAMLARRRHDLFQWFPAVLALNAIALVIFRRSVGIVVVGSEARFAPSGSFFVSGLILIAIFFLNVAMFIPLGQKIGRLFLTQKPLRAYAFDLGGSLCGTLFFGLFSLYYFSPMLGFALVAVLFCTMIRGRQWIWSLPPLVLTLILVPLSTQKQAIWSPYYYVTVHRGNSGTPAIDEPLPYLRIRPDPPLYMVCVNTNYYQEDDTLDLNRYIPGTASYNYVKNHLDVQYFLPHWLHPNGDRVCVLGAGGGCDVEGALLAGAKSVDAVEIDPILVQISRRFNAAGVYDDPRVNIHINDARAFLQSADPGYDLVVFGFLDSQALFSYSSNIRLDGFIYTVQSIRKAYSLLKPDGMLSISFVVAHPWLADKLKAMIHEATGRTPIAYADGQQVILCVSRNGVMPSLPDKIARFTRDTSPIPAIAVPTDDWPYLYLSRPTIPFDYLVVIGSLMALSIAVVLGLRHFDARILGNSTNALEEGHFFFLGAGFLLLETKSIGDCSLYFGTTWFVTMLVVTGVLIMVLAANLLAMKIKRTSLWMYVPLLATLVGLYFIPRDQILALPRTERLIWAVFIVPMPIFFAGLIFSTTFRSAKDSALVFGANLIGATVGGFFEYAGMALGTRSLGIFIIGAYLASLACLHLARSRTANISSYPAASMT